MALHVTVPLYLELLARRVPTARAALVEIAQLTSLLALPAPTVHVVSDVHGEHVKLRQVINNASGTLRPLVARELPDADDAERQAVLAHLYYPREAWIAGDGTAARLAWFARRAIVLVRALARRSTIKHVERIVPDPFDPLVRELVFADALARPGGDAVAIARAVAPFHAHGRAADLVEVLANLVRDLAVGELVIAGDLGDRGPRIDKVIELVMAQPVVAIAWGNHDASWMAASLGHAAAVATVVRISLRYQRRAQLEEGYGISLAPLEALADAVYADDPCARFHVHGEQGPGIDRLARMQKAIAIIQFKLDGQFVRRNPQLGMLDRDLLPAIAGDRVTIDGTVHPLLDTHFPTIDPRDANALTPAEQACLDELVASFLASAPLARHMRFVATRGAMSLVRDRCAIFHGCIPVDDAGAPLALELDGAPRAGKALLDAFEPIVARAFRDRALPDLDLLYYLWTGPRSPCFGKSKMATFETYFVADKAAQAEVKNPYFALLHDAAFCARMLAELGVDPARGFLVNGHVPVKLEAGELPVKRSGRAITIDGAFAAAYGDKGFSLVLDPERLYLAQHHHFESAEAAVAAGADIVPTVTDVARHDPPRTVGDTELGARLRAELAALEELVRAYDDHRLREGNP